MDDYQDEDFNPKFLHTTKPREIDEKVEMTEDELMERKHDEELQLDRDTETKQREDYQEREFTY